MSELLSSSAVCHRANVTYRQLDYWCRQGWIEGQGRPGEGNPRRWTPSQLERVIEIRGAFESAEAILREHGLAHPQQAMASWVRKSQTGSPSFRGEGRPALPTGRQTGGPQSPSEGRPPSESVDSTSPLGIGEGQVAGGAAIPPAIDLDDPFDLDGYTEADLESEIRDGHAV